MPFYYPEDPNGSTCFSLIGYAIRDRIPARSTIEELLSVYFFDTTVSDYQLKFVQRGCKTPYIIDYNDLAATSNSGEELPTYTITLPEENSLPKEVDLRYLSPLNNFQTAQQRYSRHSSVVSSVDKETISTFIALEDNYAKEVVIKILINAWESAKKLRIVLPKKYMFLDPTDLIQINTKEGTTIVARIIEIINNYNTLEIVAEFENNSNYDVIVNAADNYAFFDTSKDQVIPLASRMVSIIIDSYPLTDFFNEVYEELSYIYVGAGSYYANWPGGEIIISQNDIDYVPALFVNDSAVIGSITKTNIPLYIIKNHNYIDKITEIDIVIYNDTTEFWTNLTIEELFSSTKNTFYIPNSVGGEFIRAQNIVSLGNKQYRLSNLLRGLNHSYKNIPYHNISNYSDIVLINNSILKGTIEYGIYDVTYYYKSITIGVNEDTIPSESINLKSRWAGATPASNIQATRLNSDIIVRWSSTSNFSSGSFLGNPFIPEYKERIEIYNSSNVLINSAEDIITESYTFTPSVVGASITDIFTIKVYRYSTMKNYDTEFAKVIYKPDIKEYLSYNNPKVLYTFDGIIGTYTVEDYIGTNNATLRSNKSLLSIKNSIFREKNIGTIRIKGGQYLTTDGATFGSNEYNFTICIIFTINKKSSNTNNIPFLTRQTAGREWTINCNSYKFSDVNLDSSRGVVHITVSGDGSENIERIYLNRVLIAENLSVVPVSWTGNLLVGNYDTLVSDFDISIEFLACYNSVFSQDQINEFYDIYRELL